MEAWAVEGSYISGARWGRGRGGGRRGAMEVGGEEGIVCGEGRKGEEMGGRERKNLALACFLLGDLLEFCGGVVFV